MRETNHSVNALFQQPARASFLSSGACRPSSRCLAQSRGCARYQIFPNGCGSSSFLRYLLPRLLYSFPCPYPKRLGLFVKTCSAKHLACLSSVPLVASCPIWMAAGRTVHKQCCDMFLEVPGL